MHFKQINLSLTSKKLIRVSFVFMRIQNKIAPNIGTLLNGVLIPILVNNLFASWFLTNLDFLLQHFAHFNNIIALPLLVLETAASMFSVFFMHFKQYDSILYVEKLF